MLRRQLTSKSTKRAKSKPFQNEILKKKTYPRKEKQTYLWKHISFAGIIFVILAMFWQNRKIHEK